nr:head decoration protein [uncultured Sphaerochaeta sp.]
MSLVATVSHDSFVVDKYITKLFSIAPSAGIPARTVLGKIKIGATTVAAPVEAGAGEAGANTGTGTIVLDASPVLAGIKAGTYMVKCTKAAVADPAAPAEFEVSDPTGYLLGIVKPDTTGVVWSEHIKFTITDKATAGEEVAFAAGDGFAITVSIADGSGFLKPWAPDAVDGSEVPFAILKEDVEASEEEVVASVYVSGSFLADGIVLPAGSVHTDVWDALRALNIYLVEQADKERHVAGEEE